jgi:hypothetical protein
MATGDQEQHGRNQQSDQNQPHGRCSAVIPPRYPTPGHRTPHGFDRACVRWVERFAGEIDGVILMDIHQASRLFQLLRHRPSKREIVPMVEVLRRHGLARAADRLSALPRGCSL